MKITGVSTTLYQFTMDRRKGDANSPMGRARGSGSVIELHTDTELSGVTTGGGAATSIIRSLVDGVLIGQDPRHVTGLWQRMVNKHFKGGHDGIANDAISALDIAMWDLKAKYNDEPVVQDFRWRPKLASTPTLAVSTCRYPTMNSSPSTA